MVNGRFLKTDSCLWVTLSHDGVVKIINNAGRLLVSRETHLINYPPLSRISLDGQYAGYPIEKEDLLRFQIFNLDLDPFDKSKSPYKV